MATFVAQSDAKLFHGGDHQTSQLDVEAIPREQLDHFKAALSRMFVAMPKNDAGRLEYQAVRYVLNRFFVQSREWLIRGLEPTNDTSHASSNAEVLAQLGWVPLLLKNRLEKRTGPSGIDLDELAALAAVIEDRIHKDSARSLEDIYEVLGLRKDESIREEQADQVLETFMMVFLKRNVNLTTPEEARNRVKRYQASYRSWGLVSHWLDTEVKDPYFSLHPASVNNVDFTTMSRLVEAIQDTFGSFQNRECLELKRVLIDMGGPSRKVARIRLPEFYNKTRHTLWRFNEKIDYMRTLGTLDESNASQPLVIMPNYLLSYPNCLKETSAVNLYSICCHNECEDLMSNLEREVASPTASPEQIIDLVTVQSSDTVIAPRELPEGLLARLRDIARVHGGTVHLHSRLFAQWMHHAYPYECPYPQEKGTINPQTADEWVNATGQESAEASHEDMQKIVDDACPISEQEYELPWSHADAVLGTPVSPPPIGSLCVLVFMTLGLCGALALWSLGNRKCQSRTKGIVGGILAVFCFSICALAFGLLDGATFAVEVVVVFVYLVARHAAGDQQGKASLQKDFV